MNSHALAEQLLSLPDLPVVAWDPDSEQDEAVTGMVIGATISLRTDEP